MANGKRKGKIMTEVKTGVVEPSKTVETLPPPPTIVDTSSNDYQRGMAVLINTKRERDEALDRAQQWQDLCDERNKEIEIQKSQLVALKDLYTFGEDQSKLKMVETLNTLETYRTELIAAEKRAAKAEASLDLILNTLLHQARGRDDRKPTRIDEPIAGTHVAGDAAVPTVPTAGIGPITPLVAWPRK